MPLHYGQRENTWNLNLVATPIAKLLKSIAILVITAAFSLDKVRETEKR